MRVTAGTQAYEFFICLLTGCLIAVIYNIFWYIRKATNFNKIVSFFSDLVFGVIAVVCMFYALQYASLGAVRFYHFIGFIVGFGILNYLFSAYLRKIINKIGNAIIKFYKKLQSLPFLKKLFK